MASSRLAALAGCTSVTDGRTDGRTDHAIETSVAIAGIDDATIRKNTLLLIEIVYVCASV